MSEGLKPGPWEKIHRELGVNAPDFDDRPPGAFVELYAESIPHNTALRYHDRDISYAELNVLANRLANALVSLGVGRGDVIGVHMPNIPQYVIALIAASKIGVALSGVSPLLAPAELSRQLDDAGIKVLFSLDNLANSTLASLGRLPDCVAAVVIAGANDLRQPEELQVPDLPGVALPYLSGHDERCELGVRTVPIATRTCLADSIHGRNHRPVQGRPAYAQGLHAQCRGQPGLRFLGDWRFRSQCVPFVSHRRDDDGDDCDPIRGLLSAGSRCARHRLLLPADDRLSTRPSRAACLPCIR